MDKKYADEVVRQAVVDCRSLMGLSRREFAMRLNVSHASVCNWEQGKSVPDAGRYLIILEIFQDEHAAIKKAKETQTPMPERRERY